MADEEKAAVEAPPATDDDMPADEAASGEEDFEAGMRQNAIDYQVHDVDNDHKLDFGEFCNLVRDREDSDFTEEELRARFEALDADGSGKVDLHEYVRFALRDALSRSSSRVMDLFRQWDDDGSGEISKKEFRQAVKAMGFNFFADDAEIDMVFDEFDMDKGGTLDYRELNKQLRQGAGSALDPSLQPGAAGEISTASRNKHKLRRRDPNAKRSSMGGVQLDDSAPVQDQLRDMLAKNSTRVIDLCAPTPPARSSAHALGCGRSRSLLALRTLTLLSLHSSLTLGLRSGFAQLPRLGRRRQRADRQEGVWQGAARAGRDGAARGD
jgi:Ca2+-binding EF-hand superfamily protein